MRVDCFWTRSSSTVGSPFPASIAGQGTEARPIGRRYVVRCTALEARSPGSAEHAQHDGAISINVVVGRARHGALVLHAPALADDVLPRVRPQVIVNVEPDPRLALARAR